MKEKHPPSNKQNQNNTKQNYFFCIFKSRNKERKKNLFLGLKINKHNELGYTYYVTIPTLFFFFFFFFFSLQNELRSLLNIVKEEMDVHNLTLF